MRMASSNLPATTSSCARCASLAGSGACAKIGQVSRATATMPICILGRRHAEEDSRAGSQPIHLAPEGLFLPRVRRDTHQFAAFLLEMHLELERVLQVLIADQEIGPAILVRKLTDKNAASDRRAH